MFLTTTHIFIVMEYASGGELFEFVKRSNRLSEDAARFFFQQLISGVDYCHQQVCVCVGTTAGRVSRRCLGLSCSSVFRARGAVLRSSLQPLGWSEPAGSTVRAYPLRSACPGC